MCLGQAPAVCPVQYQVVMEGTGRDTEDTLPYLGLMLCEAGLVHPSRAIGLSDLVSEKLALP